MKQAHIMDHPLIQHKLSLIRDKNTGVKLFRESVSEIAMLMCYEAQNIYRGYAENNIESEYAKAAKRNIFGRISETFFNPAFLCAVIIFIIMAIRDI